MRLHFRTQRPAFGIWSAALALSLMALAAGTSPADDLTRIRYPFIRSFVDLGSNPTALI